MSNVVPLTIIKGATFEKVLRWGSPTPTYKDITGATAAAPCVITATGHGLVDGWPVFISRIVGLEHPDTGKGINSGTPRKARVLTSDTFALDAINAAGYSAYTSGGVVTYHAPISLSGFTARMQIRSSRGATGDPLLELTTENSRIVLDDTAKTITLALTDAVTEALTFSRGVYSLEMESSGGVVTPLVAESPVVVVSEVTR